MRKTLNIKFKDVVDILVAWHIDRTQSTDVINYTSKVLVDLRACWLKDIEFTILLLNQFLEDLESYMNVNIYLPYLFKNKHDCFVSKNYSEEIGGNDESKRLEHYDKMDKMCALIK